MDSGIKVAVRVRPFNTAEKADGSACVVRMQGMQGHVLRAAPQEDMLARVRDGAQIMSPGLSTLTARCLRARSRSITHTGLTTALCFNPTALLWPVESQPRCVHVIVVQVNLILDCSSSMRSYLPICFHNRTPSMPTSSACIPT